VPEMTARSVRSALFAAVAPLVKGTLAVYGAVRGVDRDSIRILLRPFPLPGEAPNLRIFISAVSTDDDEVDAGQLISHGLATDLPDGGRALATATERCLAGILSTLGEPGSGAALAAAAANRGSLVLMLRPVEETALLALAPPGGRALVLGALGSAEVTH